ncbi:MAG: hypothetical protein AB1742_10855 [bacterium]
MRAGDSGITFDVIGDSAPFSIIGKSSGYMITVGGVPYLVDCGAPIFHFLGDEGVRRVRGIFATHSHEDHRRWFTDFALYMRYNPTIGRKVRLITTEVIHEEYEKNSKGALERSLSSDSKRVVDVPYDIFVEKILLGPRSRYRITYTRNPGEEGEVWRVVDSDGNVVSPRKAKVFVNPKANRPRMLLRDDDTGEWVEPESYYPFSAKRFYHDDDNEYVDEAIGLRVRAIKSPAWHGPPTIALKFAADDGSRLIFGSDTVYDRKLWENLYREHRPPKMDLGGSEFRDAFVVYADINDCIERTWSRERFERAVAAYEGAVVIHDVARKNSVVHTDYHCIAGEKFDNMLYTHSPDNLVSERPILKSGKRIRVLGGEVYEEVGGELFPFDADVYWRRYARDFVGYRRKNGRHRVFRDEGLLEMDEGAGGGADEVMRVDLYEDIGGQYFPMLESEGERYIVRPDGKVERASFDEKGSSGVVVENLRGKIARE